MPRQRRPVETAALLADLERPEGGAHASCLQEAQGAGALATGDARVIATHLLHAIVFGPATDAMMGRTGWSTPAARDRFFDQAWTLFLRGAGS